MKPEKLRGETTCDAACTNADPAMIDWAYHHDLAKYRGIYSKAGNINGASSAMLYLILTEHDYPGDSNGIVRDRAIEHLRSICTGGQEPEFNAGPFWHYCAISMSIAVARHTPTIWNGLTQDDKDRLSLLMECYAILTCFISDDKNTYKTGPALTGCFGKTWNPNIRMAMILPIVASTAFFSADGVDGAARVNAILANFDHDTYIARFEQYGFTRALAAWTAESVTLENGTVAPGAKELMMNGGNAYISHADEGTITVGIKLGSDAGSGVGVRTEYTYCGFGLDDLTSIVNKLYEYNYSGGRVVSEVGGINPETGKPYAYIADGSKSPLEDELGMMFELIGKDGSGLRSSTHYGTHDFVLVVESLAALTAIGAYKLSPDSEIFRLMWVGNEDLIYKNEIGYNCYSKGKDSGIDSETKYPVYLPWKSWWRSHYGNAFNMPVR